MFITNYAIAIFFFPPLLRIFKPMTKSFNTVIIVSPIIWINRESSKVINIWRNSIMIQGFILENDERRNWHFIDVNTFNDWNPFLSFRYWLLLRFQRFIHDYMHCCNIFKREISFIHVYICLANIVLWNYQHLSAFLDDSRIREPSIRVANIDCSCGWRWIKCWI